MEESLIDIQTKKWTFRIVAGADGEEVTCGLNHKCIVTTVTVETSLC